MLPGAGSVQPSSSATTPPLQDRHGGQNPRLYQPPASTIWPASLLLEPASWLATMLPGAGSVHRSPSATMLPLHHVLFSQFSSCEASNHLLVKMQASYRRWLPTMLPGAGSVQPSPSATMPPLHRISNNSVLNYLLTQMQASFRRWLATMLLGAGSVRPSPSATTRPQHMPFKAGSLVCCWPSLAVL